LLGVSEVSDDMRTNTVGGPRITITGSRASAWIIPTDEDLMIARHTWRLTKDDGTERNR
jgi:acetate kinase